MTAAIQSSLDKSEIDFLEENLENCSVENQYFLGYFDGKRDEFEDILQRFLLLRTTLHLFNGQNEFIKNSTIKFTQRTMYSGYSIIRN